jgi:hypothetical protein
VTARAKPGAARGRGSQRRAAAELRATTVVGLSVGGAKGGGICEASGSGRQCSNKVELWAAVAADVQSGARESGWCVRQN